MAQSVACLNAVSGGLKLESGLARQGAANVGLLNGRASSVALRRNSVVVASVSSNAEEEVAMSSSSRRSMLSLLAGAVVIGSVAKDAGALSDIKIAGPPPPSGGFTGTGNVDEATNVDLDLKTRFFLQSVPPDAAYKRVKEAADEIVAVKSLIDKKAWAYVQNALRSKAQYLGFDLKTIIDSKAKPEKKQLTALKGKLLESINRLDSAARAKSPNDASKYYGETVDILGTVISKFA